MAIIISNQSICRICGRVINDDEEVVGFPRLVYSEDDRLHFFSDAGFHRQCFLNHPDKDKVWERLKELYPGQFKA
jgi:hypothetical protein